MSNVGFKARNHPQQAAKPHVDDRQTPPEVFAPLQERFGFTLDACALPHNAKLPRYFTPEQDGLAQSWGGRARVVQPAVLLDRAVGRQGGEERR